MEFCANFDVRFSEASASEKKVLLQKCLSEIIIDRERKVARIRVREIPAIHSDVANLLQNKKAHTEVVCARGSGGTIFSPKISFNPLHIEITSLFPIPYPKT